MLDFNNFTKYSSKAEKENGDYWKYLDISLEEEMNYNLDMIRMDIYNMVIKRIKNIELRNMMLDKLKELIKESRSLNFSTSIIFKIFNNDEIKNLLDDKIKYFNFSSNELFMLIDSIMKVDDNDWKIGELLILLDRIDNDYLFIKGIERTNKDKKLYYKLIKLNAERLPREYYIYLMVNNDSRYILKKQEKMLDEKVRIGIDSDISIGLEIEANGDYPFGNFLDKQEGVPFIHTSETSVTDGVEVSSSVLHDNVEGVSMIRAVCDTMKELGFYYNEREGNAGGQINLGLDYLDSAAAIFNFYEIFANCEELLWYISNKEGQIARVNIFDNKMMMPVSGIIGTRVIDEDISREDAIKLFNNRLSYNAFIVGLKYKKNSVCLRGDNESNYRFEIRIPNGGCDSEVWIDNIRLYGKIMEVSKRVADIMMKKEYLTKDELLLLKLKLELQNKNLNLEKKLDILMNLLFGKDDIKDIYYKRFKATKEKIKESGTSNYINNVNNIDEVNFLEKAKTGRMMVYSYDPFEDKYLEYVTDDEMIGNSFKIK